MNLTYQPTSITIIANGIKYEGYKTPMDLFTYTIELMRLSRGEKQDKELLKAQMVDYSKIVPVLVKAIQELKAEVDALKAK